MSFEFQNTIIPGLMIIQPRIFGDDHGYFMDIMHAHPVDFF